MNRPALAVLSTILVLAAQADAASILLDFGASPAATGTDALSSPGHQLGLVGSTETTWNLVDTTSISGLKFGDGTTSSVNLTVATEAANNDNTIAFATGSRGINTVSVTGTAAGVGSIYAGNRPARQGVFTLNQGATVNAALGVSITGLLPGTYSIFVTGRNTNTGGNAVPASFYLSLAAGAPTSYLFSGSGNTTLSTAVVTNTLASLSDTTFTEGVTYAAFQNITIGENGSLLLATEGNGPNEFRGFFNSIEIVSVPEPSTVGLALGGVVALGLRRRRAI